MDQRFAAYNTHHYNPDQYWQNDNHLRLLRNQPYQYQHPLIQELPQKHPGVYTLGGGRQIGKTTLLKQWIASLMEAGVPAKSIIFYTGELIDDHHALVDLLREATSHEAGPSLLYLIVDEITYVKEWDKGIKFAADAGYLQNSVVVLTGSDLTLMQSARMTFPGRRGKADKVDFHIYSLSFKEFLILKKSLTNIKEFSEQNVTPNETEMRRLYEEFENYLRHGGYLTAINDMARNGRIATSTLKIYSDWIRGDVLKRGKQETYLKEILNAIIKRYNKQVTWHNISDSLSIDSHKTVSDYCELLSIMDALFIQYALLEDKLCAAPKKARKLTFTDPFIYHSIKQWLNPVEDPDHQINSDAKDPHIGASLVEAIVSNQYHRYYPTYYIKNEGEIDVAYVHDGKFWPIEVKWRNQLRPEDVKLISKYKRSRIFSKVYKQNQINGIPIEPLPLALLQD